MAIILPEVIKNQLQKNKLSHAYLFYGPGAKNKTAMSFARIILAGSFDFIILKKPEDKTKILIEQIRETIKRVSHKAIGKRVILIKKAELLSLDAANALLKTLEEPSLETIFILTTSNIKEVIPTIISRCQGYYLADKDKNQKNSGLREKQLKDFLKSNLIERFKFSEEIAKMKGQALPVLNHLVLILRREMIKETKIKAKKRLAAEIKRIEKARLLLKRNISARLILEDLSLFLSRRK